MSFAKFDKNFLGVELQAVPGYTGCQTEAEHSWSINN